MKLLGEAHYEIENENADIIISPWGSSKGPAREAYERLLASGVDIGWAYSVALNPLPEKISDVLSKAEKVIVPELNYQGQWSALLRQDGINAESIVKYDGTPFRPGELVSKILNFFKTEVRK